MAETTVAVPFSQCGRGVAVDEVETDTLAMHARIVDEDGTVETRSGKLHGAARCRVVT
jgi:hypothetical protein